MTQYCDEQHLTPKERLELFLPICQAVQHAHQKGIIHRDLKPSNVMIALYDDRAVPKVIDFGVAKATSQTLTERTMFTQLGQIVGTLEYMSPEQAQRNQMDIDTRSDIYSLGVLLYELLTGDTPFDRQRLRSAVFDEMLRIIREEEPLKPSTKVSGSESLASIAANRKIEPAKLSVLVRGELDWIVMKALEKDRGRRYATATSFAEDIQHYLNDEAVVACPPSARYRFRKFVRRNRPLIATGALVTAALVLGLVGTTWQAIRANNQSLRATSAESLAKQRLEQEQEARKQVSLQRDRALAAEKAAEARFQIATEAVERYLNEVADDPELTTGNFQDLRRRLLESAMPFYEKLIEEKPQNRDQILAQSAAHSRLWRVQFYYFSNFDAALSHAEQTLNISLQLANDDPEDGANKRRLAGCHNVMGMTLDALGDTKRAREHFEQAYQIARSIVKAFPDVTAYKSSLATHIGNWALHVGNSKEADQLQREAVAIKEELHKKFPEHRGYRDGLSWYLANLGDLASQQRALEIREGLARDFPEYPKYRKHVAMSLTSLGQSYQKAGEWEQARSHHERAIEIRSALAREFSMPDYLFGLAEAHRELAKMLRQQEQLEEACEHNEEALRILEPLVEQVPEYREMLISVQCDLGKTLYRQGEWQAALEMLQKADKLLDGGINWNRFVMAMAHWQLGDMEEARTVYWDAVSKTVVGNDNNELRGFRTEAEQVLGISSEERVAFEVDQLTKFIEADPDHLEALRGRADIYKNMKQWVKAIDDYSNIIRLNADDAYVYRDRYTCYREIGEYDSALADITRAIELRPDDEWCYQKRGSLRIYNMKQFDEGIADCDQALRIDPRNLRSYFQRGKAHKYLNEYDAAIKDFSSVIDLNIDSADTYKAYDERGRTYLAMEKYEPAIEDFSRAIELKPNAKTYQARADSYRELENYEAALADLSRAIELAPKNDAYYVARARVRIVHLKKNREGIVDCDEALRINPNNFNALLHRARAHARLGEHDAAITDAAAGLKFSADSVIRRNVLAEVLRTSGGSETLDEFKELKEYFAAVESDTQKTQE